MLVQRSDLQAKSISLVLCYKDCRMYVHNAFGEYGTTLHDGLHESHQIMLGLTVRFSLVALDSPNFLRICAVYA
jgi:hypothetical protein